MKCNQSRPGFELVSPCPFLTTIAITPRAPQIYLGVLLLTRVTRYYLTQSSGKGVHAFLKGITSKVNVTERLKFDVTRSSSITTMSRGHLTDVSIRACYNIPSSSRRTNSTEFTNSLSLSYAIRPSRPSLLVCLLHSIHCLHRVDKSINQPLCTGTRSIFFSRV